MKKQVSPEKKVKLLLIEKELKQKDLIPLLKEKHPTIDIQEPHISKALAGKYPSMLEKINEIILELA